ncbi:hypothetical protein DPMN_072015 [Dreissena polymorpha]|uniref:Uncharacterized protein n=1 Tax=Dreissena polymorpha TaxID=45954 RepID=A0A9D3Z3W8_DREPO|nr:hypothetical protein DPMN_072015 [Dreissena polymorpha]
MKTNVLTKFHSVHKKNAPTPRQPYIIETNPLTKFHEDGTINVASRPYMEKYPPNGGHVFQPTGTIIELIQYFIGTNLETKFHEDRTINVALRVNKGAILSQDMPVWTT